MRRPKWEVRQTMGDPGYDFFATGRPTGQQRPEETSDVLPSASSASVSRFGGVAAPPAPAPAHAARGGQFGPPTVATPTTTAPTAAEHAYNPPAVNQFGTPIGAAPAPTGPYAAPGVAAVPVAVPGMVSTWERAGSHSRTAPAPRRGSAGIAVKPGTVTAAAVIGIVEGALLLGLTLLGLVAYLALRSELDSFSASSGGQGLGALGAAAAAAALVALVLLLAISALYLVAGIAAVRGHRWGAWTLLAVSALTVLVTLYDLLRGTTGIGSALLTLLVSGSVVVLLGVADSQRWMRAS